MLKDKYCSKVNQRVLIGTGNWKNRQSGIRTIIERVIKQARVRMLTPVYEHQFSLLSFGLRVLHDAQYQYDVSVLIQLLSENLQVSFGS